MQICVLANQIEAFCFFGSRIFAGIFRVCADELQLHVKQYKSALKNYV